MKSAVVTLFIFTSYCLLGQTWSGEVATIFYEKCAKCHHQGGGGPFPLVEYNDVAAVASSIYDAVYQDRMPPWPPNEPSAEFLHDRTLSASEKETVLNWMTSGYPEGSPTETPPPPVFNEGSILGNGDLEVQIPTYSSKAVANDDYVCFSLPANLTEERIIKAVEVIPGNPEIVHHVLVYVDQNGTEVTDTIGGNCASPSSLETKLVGGFTPGSTPIIFPNQDPVKLGVTVAPGANIYLNMHYPIGSFGILDSTKVIFHFYPPGVTDVREVISEPLLINYTFNLPPNQITNVNATYPYTGTTPTDYSLFSIFPHMHLLGKEIGTYAVRPGQDTLPLIHIPHWDFDWQDFYKFRYLQKLPAGSRLRAYGTYDNTASNIHNPFSPPQAVQFGLNTTDEMFVTYLQYLPYEDGDESYDLSELTTVGLNDISMANDAQIKAYPNPFFEEGIYLEFDDPIQSTNVIIYNSLGIAVKSFDSITNNTLFWDGKNDGVEVSPGIYYVSANINGHFLNKRIIKTQ